MSEQNIYDNQMFFDGYKKLRENPSASNIIVEKPALFSLCPSFTDKTVLDVGCGYGENCREIANIGATHVVGIDISKRMLEIAEIENKCENVSFLQMSMNDLPKLHQKFDIVISSLAIHYIEDFDKLMKNINRLLNDSGLFIYSQEHPLTTALKKEDYWSIDDKGDVLHYNLTDYSLLGERKTAWIVDEVIKYHRTFSSIINSIINSGFIIEKMLEPLPDEGIMNQYPVYRKYYHKPDFLLIRARKTIPIE
jgi:SAM-dependent methyltransferase